MSSKDEQQIIHAVRKAVESDDFPILLRMGRLLSIGASDLADHELLEFGALLSPQSTKRSDDNDCKNDHTVSFEKDVRLSLVLFEHVTQSPKSTIGWCAIAWLELWNVLRREFTFYDPSRGQIALRYRRVVHVPTLSSWCGAVIRKHQLLEQMEWVFGGSYVKQSIPEDILRQVHEEARECSNTGCSRGISKRCGAGYIDTMKRQERGWFYGSGRVEWIFRKRKELMGYEDWLQKMLSPMASAVLLGSAEEEIESPRGRAEQGKMFANGVKEFLAARMNDETTRGVGGDPIELRLRFCSMECSRDVERSFALKNVDHMHLLYSASLRDY